MKYGKLGPYKGETYGSVMESYIIAPLCESPIEIRFESRLSESLRQSAEIFFGFGYAILPYGEPFKFPRSFLVLSPQFKLSGFRYDFAVHVSSEETPELLIECDGKDFHSSVEQKRNDLRKDDAASAKSIKMLRFTGSEIYQSVDWCVAQALVPLFQKWRLPSAIRRVS